MTEKFERCPVHSNPDEPLSDWPCPVAYEDSPPEVETCPYFEAEMLRRMADMAEGNYVELTEYDENDVRWWQSYANHEPVGEPRKAWTRQDLENEEEV